MNAPTKHQLIHGPDGEPAFVVIPYREYVDQYGSASSLIPDDVMGKIVEDGLTPMRAWREYRGFTQVEVAARMEVSQSAYAQLESSTRPRKSTLDRAARALKVTLEQLRI
tara:strand:+ start:1795 stop:2124 length:330 start_codon:yes stop_codon:yes gene_type:complete